MVTIKKVALIGASGSLGSVILEKLQLKFDVTVIRRPSSAAKFPPSTKVIDVALSSLEDLTAALKGQDAVISALGTSQVLDQKHLADACIAAGVYRLIPAEFGADVENPKVQSLPIYGPHLKIREDIITKSKNSSLTYTFIHNGAFLDWGLQHDFVLKISDYKPILLDGGNGIFSATTVASIADAVFGVLTHPEETKNRAVYIEDVKVTQKKLLELAMKITPFKPWAATEVSLDELTAEADRKVAAGHSDEASLIPYLYRAVMDPECGGNFQITDNQLLGLRGKTEEELVEIIRKHIK